MPVKGKFSWKIPALSLWYPYNNFGEGWICLRCHSVIAGSETLWHHRQFTVDFIAHDGDHDSVSTFDVFIIWAVRLLHFVDTFEFYNSVTLKGCSYSNSTSFRVLYLLSDWIVTDTQRCRLVSEPFGYSLFSFLFRAFRGCIWWDTLRDYRKRDEREAGMTCSKGPQVGL